MTTMREITEIQMYRYDEHWLRKHAEEAPEQPSTPFVLVVVGAIVLSMVLAVATATAHENAKAEAPAAGRTTAHQGFDPMPLMLAAALVSPELVDTCGE